MLGDTTPPLVRQIRILVLNIFGAVDPESLKKMNSYWQSSEDKGRISPIRCDHATLYGTDVLPHLGKMPYSFIESFNSFLMSSPELILLVLHRC